MTGIADAACWSAVLSLLLQMFPDKVAKIMALTETSFGLGLMIGPALGSLLFQAGGFKLPFIVVGGAACVVAVVLPFALARVDSKPEENLSNGVSNGNGAISNGNGAISNGNGAIGNGDSNGTFVLQKPKKISYREIMKVTKNKLT